MLNRPESARIYEWFNRWRSPLRRFLARKGSFKVADLDDMAQEVFLRLLRYGNAEVIQYPQAYLFKIAANVANEWAIRPGERLSHDSRWLDDLVVEDTVNETLDDGAIQTDIKRAVMNLAPRERAVIKLHFDEGLTRTQIAARLGLTERTVKRELERSYGKLRLELGAQRHG